MATNQALDFFGPAGAFKENERGRGADTLRLEHCVRTAAGGSKEIVNRNYTITPLSTDFILMENIVSL